jgi:hypothetical protein
MRTAQTVRVRSWAAVAAGPRRAGMAGDFALLAVATLLPLVPFISLLGIYADDWGVLAFYRANGDRTFVDYFFRLYSLPITHMRPAQVLYEAVMYHVFETKPIGYHVTNALVFLTAAWLLYLCLRLILRQRFLAVAIPLVFILLPNYSSARFVPFAFMAGLSMAFFFLNLYAMLKATQNAALGWSWTIASVVALLISGLAYEVAIPLFALSFMVVWYLQRKKPVADRLQVRSLALVLVPNAIALLSVLAFKALTTTRYHGVATISSMVRQTVHVNFYALGLRLPIVFLRAVVRFWDPTLCVLAVLLGAVVFWHLWRIQLGSETEGWGSGEAFELTAVGFIVFALGNAIFLVSAGEVEFTPTGVANRTAIAASLGMAIIFVAGAMWIGILASRKKEIISSLLIALLSTCTFLITGTIGAFWAAAAQQQQTILRSVQHDVPSPPANTTLLVDGICPYIGPGIVFEGAADMGGALQLLYRDPTLRGDVVTPEMEVQKEGIHTTLYQLSQFYPYGPELKVYNMRSKTLLDIPDPASAQKYFGSLGPVRTSCPPGVGVSIFDRKSGESRRSLEALRIK